jgi:hypothetical protein
MVTSLAPACAAAYQAVIACMQTATFTCDANGESDTTACDAQLAAVDTCTGGSTTPAPTGWVCTAAWYGTDDGCDCGCGIPDPDCAGGGCIAPGCDDAGALTECVTSN